jgi:hypothetical protein
MKATVTARRPQADEAVSPDKVSLLRCPARLRRPERLAMTAFPEGLSGQRHPREKTDLRYVGAGLFPTTDH